MAEKHIQINNTERDEGREENRREIFSGKMSRASFVSSYAEEDSQSLKRKRIETEADLEMDSENMAIRSVIDEIRYEREILEGYLFNDNNKINKNAMKFIFSKWAILESRLQQEHLDKEKIMTKHKEFLNNKTKKFYARVTSGNKTILKDKTRSLGRQRLIKTIIREKTKPEKF